MDRDSYYRKCERAYPYVNVFPEPSIILELWAFETERRSTRPHSVTGLELAHIPERTLERLIHSNDFAKMCGLAGSGRPPKSMFVAVAKRPTDTSRGRKVIEDRLGLGEIFDDPAVTMFVGIFERDVRSHVAKLLVVAGIVDHGDLLEIRALASVQTNLGYGEQFMRKIQDKGLRIFLFSSHTAERFYERLGFTDCSDRAVLSRCVSFVNARALVWNPDL
jgi:hypothetical protein